MANKTQDTPIETPPVERHETPFGPPATPEPPQPDAPVKRRNKA